MHLDSSNHMLSDARAAAQPPIPCNDHRRRLPLSLCFTQVATESPLVFFSFGRVEHSSVETPEESHEKKQKWWYVSDSLVSPSQTQLEPSHPYGPSRGTVRTDLSSGPGGFRHSTKPTPRGHWKMCASYRGSVSRGLQRIRHLQ